MIRIESRECPICLQNQSNMVILPCQHIFCEPCMDRALEVKLCFQKKESQSCPLCRRVYCIPFDEDYQRNIEKLEQFHRNVDWTELVNPSEFKLLPLLRCDYLKDEMIVSKTSQILAIGSSIKGELYLCVQNAASRELNKCVVGQITYIRKIQMDILGVPFKAYGVKINYIARAVVKRVYSINIDGDRNKVINMCTPREITDRIVEEEQIRGKLENIKLFLIDPKNQNLQAVKEYSHLDMENISRKSMKDLTSLSLQMLRLLPIDDFKKYDMYFMRDLMERVIYIEQVLTSVPEQYS